MNDVVIAEGDWIKVKPGAMRAGDEGRVVRGPRPNKFGTTSIIDYRSKKQGGVYIVSVANVIRLGGEGYE